MLNLFKKIWGDIRKGENIDLYLTILVGLALATANLFGFAPDNWLASITLAVLALLAISNLGNRYKLEMLLEQKAMEDLFLEEYPQTRTDEMRRANELWMVGINLHRTLYANPWLGEKLQNKHKIKVLLLNPKTGALKYVVSRFASEHNQAEEEARKRSTIKESLGTLSKFMKRYPDCLEVRITDYPLSFGSFAIDISSPKGIIYIEQYNYKMSGKNDLPKFFLKPKDGVWYEHYKKQIMVLWENAIPFGQH